MYDMVSSNSEIFDSWWFFVLSFSVRVCPVLRWYLFIIRLLCCITVKCAPILVLSSKSKQQFLLFSHDARAVELTWLGNVVDCFRLVLLDMLQVARLCGRSTHTALQHN